MGNDVFAHFDFSNSLVERDMPHSFFFDGSLRDLQDMIGDHAYFMNVDINRTIFSSDDYMRDISSARNLIKDIETEKHFFEKLTIAFCGLPNSCIKDISKLIEQVPDRTDYDNKFHKVKSQGR